MVEQLPELIQGGMAIDVSGWKLAKAVAMAQEGRTMGIVACTGAELILAKRLGLGDQDLKRALLHFPNQEIAQRIIDTYFGKKITGEYQDPPLFNLEVTNEEEVMTDPKSPIKLSAQPELMELITCATFAQIWLAKEGHQGLIGMNLLEKVQLPILPALFGAILADIDWIVMGAGFPNQVPGILDQLVNLETVSYRLEVHGTKRTYELIFDPKSILSHKQLAKYLESRGRERLRRSNFAPIVTNHIAAKAVKTRANSEIQGLIVEGPTAGGHNAKHREEKIINKQGEVELNFNKQGEPKYGLKDRVNFRKLKKLGLPFWLAGSYGSPEKLAKARKKGAAGIQAGSFFALCQQSNYFEEDKEETLENILTYKQRVFCNPHSSPSGFPFEELVHAGTLSHRRLHKARKRRCRYERLAELYEIKTKENGKVKYSIGKRCSAGPESLYRVRGGKEETGKRKCLCTALFADVGLEEGELKLLTLGKYLRGIRQFLKLRVKQGKKLPYTAEDAVDYLLVT